MTQTQHEPQPTPSAPTSAPGPSSTSAQPHAITPSGAPAPTGAAPASTWAVVLGIVVAAAGLLLLRDAAVAVGLLGGTPVTTPLVDRLRSVGPQAWYVPVGVVVALVGLWLVAAALRRRPRRDLAVGDSSLVWLTPSAAAAIARASAAGVDGVVEARATAGRRSVRVTARTTTRDPEVGSRITSAVEQSLRGLAPVPKVRVTTRAMGDAA
ncbi:hypothetical protein GCM10009868_34450 [Terrabacter aerolatus]|uniref:DUF6286 domain-containing protein n=1 Tax=Terrabacter aerolatus TaxID=422442 RepID=A0A512CX34_9MICO|nr:DUF6286 domain-containing protein [Terrabacter aerolatus]GEO28570.1 hypothetical protein TAE01_03800 [Terrabacter aerolatus]